MATFYGSTAYGNGTARYRLELEVTQSSTRAGTVTAYWVAVADVVGGYNFSNGNSFSITVNGTSLYSSSNVGTIQCQSTGTRTKVWSGSWSVGSSVNQATFAATFKQTQATQYSSSVSGTLTFASNTPTGHLDVVDPTYVFGWCGASGSTAQYALTIKIYNSSGTLLEEFGGTANLSRPDLVQAGATPDEWHGYKIPYDFAVELGAGTYTVKGWAVYNNGASTYQFPEVHTITIADRICIWTGETWKSGDAHVYNGSAWKEGTAVKAYNGSAWK